MKYLIITAIKAFEKEIKFILKKAKINEYSYKDVTSYRDFSELSMHDNWFANEMNEGASIIFYAFVKDEDVDPVFKLVKTFNEKQKTVSTIHVAILNIEKSI